MQFEGIVFPEIAVMAGLLFDLTGPVGGESDVEIVMVAAEIGAGVEPDVRFRQRLLHETADRLPGVVRKRDPNHVQRTFFLFGGEHFFVEIPDFLRAQRTAENLNPVKRRFICGFCGTEHVSDVDPGVFGECRKFEIRIFAERHIVRDPPAFRIRARFAGFIARRQQFAVEIQRKMIFVPGHGNMMPGAFFPCAGSQIIMDLTVDCFRHGFRFVIGLPDQEVFPFISVFDDPEIISAGSFAGNRIGCRKETLQRGIAQIVGDHLEPQGNRALLRIEIALTRIIQPFIVGDDETVGFGFDAGKHAQLQIVFRESGRRFAAGGMVCRQIVGVVIRIEQQIRFRAVQRTCQKNCGHP